MKGRRTENIRYRPFNVVLRLKELFCGIRQHHGKRHAAESVNAAQVIFRPRLIDDAFVARGVIETVRVRDNSNMRQAVEEDQSSELELLILARRRKARPVSARAAAHEINADLFEGAPNKT